MKTEDINKLNQEKKALQLELDFIKKHAKIVVIEVKERNNLIKSFVADSTDIENKIQELSEKIDYTFLENTKIKCHCNDDERIEECYANCDFTGFCPECNDRLVCQVNSNIKNCINCGHSSKETSTNKK